MATQDTSKEDENQEDLDEEVETGADATEDETTDEDTDKDSEDTEDEGDDSDDDSDDDDSEEEDEDTFKKAFSQIKGDTPEEYLPNVEEAYRKSSQEGKRLAQELKEAEGRTAAIMAAVANDPDLAAKLQTALKGASGDKAILPTEDPAVVYARTQMREQMASEYETFMEEHPEVDSDPQLQEELLEAMQDYKDVQVKKGRLPTMGEALRKAWIMLGRDDTEEKVRVKAKETASKSKTNSSNKKGGKKPVFSEAQLAVAKKFGLTEKQLAASLETESKD